jgi:hypothetical protein
VPLQDAKDYIAMSSGPKTVQFYDADHALNAKAGVDRDEFLHKKTQVSALTRLIATFQPCHGTSSETPQHPGANTD